MKIISEDEFIDDVLADFAKQHAENPQDDTVPTEELIAIRDALLKAAV